MKIYLGTDNSKELVYLKWDKHENEQRKTFSLTGGSYREPMTESEGEQQAKESLEDGELWRMAVEAERTEQSLSSWAKDVLNLDGWMHTLGDIEDFGEHQGESIYLQLSSCGQHQEEIKNFLNLWIDKEDLEKIYSLWENYHIKSLTKEKLKKIYSEMDGFFEKHKKFCSDSGALKQYLKDIDY